MPKIYVVVSSWLHNSAVILVSGAAVYSCVQRIHACRRWDGIGGEFVDSFPCIAATRSKIAALPKVQEMYGSESGYEP